MKPSRLDACFEKCRKEGRKALVLYVTAGDPSLAVTEELIPAVAAAGADIIELGIPFSDPMADGPVIQAASQRALAAGTTLTGILDMARRLQARITTPLVLFSYYNVLLQYGTAKLAAESAAAGIDGWLVVDVPAEEAAEIEPILRQHGLHRIVLLAPTTTPERAAQLLQNATGFVYYIAVTGVTGARAALPPDLTANLDAFRKLTPLPIVAGFGVSSPEMARLMAAHADGVVVGSALVKLMGEASTPAVGIQQATAFVRSLAAALKS